MNTPSSENINLLPDPVSLQRMCKSISVLEAIICPEWDSRYYSYQKEWSEKEEIFTMRNGQGDEMLILFSPDGVCINGFAHESKMNGWTSIRKEEKKSFFQKLLGAESDPEFESVQNISAGVVDELPEVFHEFVFGEPVKSIGTTFCIWWSKSDEEWKKGKTQLPDDEYKDGSAKLMKILDGNPETYKSWAEGYYEEEFDERELPLNMVEKIYKGEPVSKEIIESINPDLEDMESLKSDLDEIGYE